MPYEITELTMLQFNRLLNALGREIDWALHLTTLQLSGKYDKTLNPLYPDPNMSKEQGRGSRNDTTLDGFINKINKLGKFRV